MNHQAMTDRLIASKWPDLAVTPLLGVEKKALIMATKSLLQAHDACLIAHYYVDESLQSLARDTGGMIGDSLQMAQFGVECSHQTLMVAGVKFMGETAKILSPEKTVLMPTLEATCSLDLGCPVDDFKAFCGQHPDRDVVVYANTSAAVKACADWVVTSSIALDVIRHLSSQGKKILWAPDKHLGKYIQQQTHADMVLWDASCVVHEEFKSVLLDDLLQQHPDAMVLVHPESPASVIAMADVVGSTAKLLKATMQSPKEIFIVATDAGIFAEMKRLSPHKTFLLAPTAGAGAHCRSCGHCPWMAQNTLMAMHDSLNDHYHEVLLSDALIQSAKKPLQRMLDFQQHQS